RSPLLWCLFFSSLCLRPPPRPTLFPYTTLFRSLIVRVRDRDELFRGACRIAIEAGQFPMAWVGVVDRETRRVKPVAWGGEAEERSEEHTSELQSLRHLVCRLLLEKKKKKKGSNS